MAEEYKVTMGIAPAKAVANSVEADRAKEEKAALAAKQAQEEKANNYLMGWKTGVTGGGCKGREEKREFMDGYMAGIKFWRKQVVRTRKAFGLEGDK